MQVSSNTFNNNFAFSYNQKQQNSNDFATNLYQSLNANTASNNKEAIESNNDSVISIQAILSEIAIKENFGFLQQIQETKAANNDSNQEKIMGFKVDEKGFLTQDFNKAAGIPESAKIHKNTIERLISTDSVKTMQQLTNLFGSAYAKLQELVGDKLATDKGYYTKEELSTFPQYYSTRDGSFNSETKKVVYEKGMEGTSKFSAGRYNDIIGLNPIALSITPNEIDLQIDDKNWGAKSYVDDKNNLSEGGLLAYFVNTNAAFHQSSNFSTKSYYDVIEGKMTKEEYLKAYSKSFSSTSSDNDIELTSDKKGRNTISMRNISFAAYLQEKGFSSETLDGLNDEDFQKLKDHFLDLETASHRLAEEEKHRQENLKNSYFDIESFLLNLYGTSEYMNPDDIDAPETLLDKFKEINENFEAQKKDNNKDEKLTLTKRISQYRSIVAAVEQMLDS